ncbi:MAG: hypothetical protein EOO38_02630 [Cytophagaceae bacterium]|nr:MAG: hypothetical protein EOO38_02630 [Cytophagaceae bacterium]
MIYLRPIVKRRYPAFRYEVNAESGQTLMVDSSLSAFGRTAKKTGHSFSERGRGSIAYRGWIAAWPVSGSDTFTSCT